MRPRVHSGDVRFGAQRLALVSLRQPRKAIAAPAVARADPKDADRRRLLSTRLGSVGQTLVTATGAEALPLAPAQLLAVTPGRVEAPA